MPPTNAPRNGADGLKAQTGITPPPAMSPAQRIDAMIRTELPRIQRLIQNPKMTTRFAQLALTEMRKNPVLFECDPSTVLGCLMTAASLGLQLGVGGQAYLIPYRVKGQMVCTFVPGWKGLMSLMHRSGEAEAQTGVVREGDTFRFSLGSDPHIEHVVKSERDSPITHFYAWGRATGARYPVVEVWTRRDVERHLSKYNKVGGMHYALKDGGVNFEMYGRKVPLLQVLKYLPVSFEMEQAMELDGTSDAGRQTIKPEDVIEGVVMQSMSPEPVQERDSKTPCDGNHATPRCEADVCWHDDTPKQEKPEPIEIPNLSAYKEELAVLGWTLEKNPEEFAAMREVVDKVAGPNIPIGAGIAAMKEWLNGQIDKQS